MTLAIVLALVGCKDKKDGKPAPGPGTGEGTAKKPDPRPDARQAALPEVAVAATGALEGTAFIRIAEDGTIGVGAVPEGAIKDGKLVVELPAGASTMIENVREEMQKADPPIDPGERKRRAIEDAQRGGIIAPMPGAWPREGDLHAREGERHEYVPHPIVLASPNLSAARFLDVIRATGRGAQIAVITDGGAVARLIPHVKYVSFGAAEAQPSEVLVVIRPGDDPVAVFDKAIADAKRDPASGHPWVRLQPGDETTAGALISAIAALYSKSPYGFVLGQTTVVDARDGAPWGDITGFAE